MLKEMIRIIYDPMRMIINDLKKKIKIVKEDVEDNNINKFKENLEERLD